MPSGLAPHGRRVHTFLLYRDGLGVTYLNSAIDPASGWTLGTPYDINESGQIVGTGFRGGVQRTFLLTPIPEPSSLLLAGLAVAGAATRGRCIAAALARCLRQARWESSL